MAQFDHSKRRKKVSISIPKSDYFPTVNDTSVESAKWFMDNGFIESAKKVVENIEKDRVNTVEFTTEILQSETENANYWRKKAEKLESEVAYLSEIASLRGESISDLSITLEIANGSLERERARAESLRAKYVKTFDALMDANETIRENEINLALAEKRETRLGGKFAAVRESYRALKRHVLKLEKNALELKRENIRLQNDNAVLSEINAQSIDNLISQFLTIEKDA